MTPEQHYIFPTEGVTQEGDQYFLSNGIMSWWLDCQPGDVLDHCKAYRRPVAPQPLRWIAYSERKPTEADADEEGCVVAFSTKRGKFRLHASFTTSDKQWMDGIFWHPLLSLSAIPEPDTCRAEFEAWWIKETGSSGCLAEKSHDGKDYKDIGAACAWSAWQAARKEKP